MARTPGKGAFYSSGYFATTLALFCSLVAVEAWLASSPLSVVVLVLLAPAQLDCCLLLLLRLKALNIGLGDTPDADPAERESWPAISVVMPSYQEPFEVKKMTLDSLLDIDYPGRLEVISVDNSRDTRSEDFQRWQDHTAALGVLFIHNPDAAALKAGNLELALEAVTGDYVLIVDVDSTMPANPAGLLAAIRDFETDPRLGYVQFHVAPTNRHVNAFTRGVARFQHMHNAVETVAGLDGFPQFKGHNTLWRKAALDATGGWRERLGGRPLLAEDLFKAFQAYARGYRGSVSVVATGEWIPSTLADFTSMWNRWLYGTIQAKVRRGVRALLHAPEFTVFEKIEIFRRTSFGMLCMPYLALVAALAFPSPVFVPYLVLVAVKVGAGLAVGSRLDARFGTRLRGRAAVRAHAVAVLAECFAMWIGCTATLRFVMDQLSTRDGMSWTVTAKGRVNRPRLMDLVRQNGAVHVCQLVLVAAAGWLLVTDSTGPAETFVRLYGLLLFGGILLSPLYLGRLGRGGSAEAAAQPRSLPGVAHA